MLTKVARLFALVSSFVVLASSVIVFGILVAFLQDTAEYNITTTHIIVQIIVAGCSMVLYLGRLVFPQFRDYPLITIPLGGCFSYLWLTSAIFAAEDWQNNRCQTGFPVFESCSLKKAVIAFDFIAFFFILADICVIALTFAYDSYHQKRMLDEMENKRTDQSQSPFVNAPASGTNGANGATGDHHHANAV